MRRSALVFGAIVALLVGLLVLVTRIEPPSVTESAVRDALFTTIQRETAQAFLVTGRLDLTVTTRVENTKTLLPGIVDLDLGTTRATVRVPGRVSYGFPAASLRPEMVTMLEDGTIEIQLPDLVVYSVEPDLGRLEVETERGWARLGAEAESVEQRALEIVERAMRQQAEAHLSSSYQSKVNTARALDRMLSPPLRGLGMEAPRFRFRIAEDLVVEPSG